MSTVVISNRDRFSFALFLALSLHAVLILGIGFSSDANMPETTSIDVTLSIAADTEAPEDADFIAATNQQGSGSEDEVMEMTATQQTDFQTNQFEEVLSQPAPVEESSTPIEQVVTTTMTMETQANDDFEELKEELANPVTNRFDREKLVQEIASLEARIAQDQQALANMPRTKRISSVSTRSAAEAAYLDMWRQKCERIGAINYPAGQLEGEVLLLVSILHDGSLQEVRVLKSSGHRQLDTAALATVRQAAPFQPFNVEMRKAYDRLEFTRWWQFTKLRSGLQSRPG